MQRGTAVDHKGAAQFTLHCAFDRCARPQSLVLRGHGVRRRGILAGRPAHGRGGVDCAAATPAAGATCGGTLALAGAAAPAAAAPLAAAPLAATTLAATAGVLADVVEPLPRERSVPFPLLI